MRVGIIGCGLIGTRRAQTALASGDELLYVVDVTKERADELARKVGAVRAEWSDVIKSDVDVVVVATPNKFLQPTVVEALQAGKHVLCEKPLGRNAAEAETMVEAAKTAGRTLKTGLNHRHKQAISAAYGLLEKGAIGRPFAIRAAYGHGGRAGYNKEWRGDPELAGGGELLDQGVHVVDLCRWFLGEFVEATGVLGTWFWDVEPLEDNAFVLLRTEDGRVASFHTSWTQWRNLFRFEVLGTDGYLVVDGLGGSYGAERLTRGRRRNKGGVPEEETVSFPGEDLSWANEWREFKNAVEFGRQPLGSGEDGLAAARILDAVYAAASTGRVTRVGLA
ncbi:MAG: Gfo/Idh/MocA family protein [Gaiellaceae bacterium]